MVGNVALKRVSGAAPSRQRGSRTRWFVSLALLPGKANEPSVSTQADSEMICVFSAHTKKGDIHHFPMNVPFMSGLDSNQRPPEPHSGALALPFRRSEGGKERLYKHYWDITLWKNAFWAGRTVGAVRK